jgi:anti-sigma regulatory factor (Ser/Thr protein kinase)
MEGVRSTQEWVEYVHHCWPADTLHLAEIRDAVRGWLEPMSLAEGEAADLVQAVDEAVANVVAHAYPPGEPGEVELTLWTESAALYVEIIDHGNWQPPAGQTTSETLGLTLMSGMVEAVLIHYDARGSRVLLRHPLATGRVPK